MLNTGFTVVQDLIISFEINTTTTSTREMCGSRNYPYPFHGWIFGSNPHSSGNSTLTLKVWLLKPPPPLPEFPVTIHGVAMDIFLELHTCNLRSTFCACVMNVFKKRATKQLFFD